MEKKLWPRDYLQRLRDWRRHTDGVVICKLVSGLTCGVFIDDPMAKQHLQELESEIAAQKYSQT